MATYAAFLRSINVGGNNIIKMEELRKIFALPGITDITTYIQSGNVLFNTDENDPILLEKKFEEIFTKRLNYPTPVMIRDLKEMQMIVKNDPFKDTRGKDGVKSYVSLLPRKPDNKSKALIEGLSTDIDVYKFAGRELYINVYPNKGLSLYLKTAVEKKLGMPATTRNWKTIAKMIELLKAYKD